MNNYIGIKLLQAKPMTRGEYNDYKGNGVGEIRSDEGYLVKYSDTYESWSPKDVFESAYLPIESDSKISPADFKNMIASITTSKIDEKTTLVKAELTTGFVQYATSSCVDPKNYDENIGKEVACKQMDDKLWFALGFVLQWARFGLKKVNKL